MRMNPNPQSNGSRPGMDRDAQSVNPISRVSARLKRILPAAALFAVACCALLAIPTSAQTLKLKFGFEDTGTSTADSVAGVLLNLTNNAGLPADLHGAPGTGVSGLGQALDFTSAAGDNTAANNCVAATVGNAAVNFGTFNSFTVTMWIKPGVLNTYQRYFVLGTNGTSDSGAANSLAILGNGGSSPTSCQANLNAYNSGALTGLTNIVLNQWNFLAYTYDGTTIKVYTANEGSPVVSGPSQVRTGTNFNLGTTFTMMLGNRLNRARGYKGYIDDVRFYTGAGDVSFLEAVRRQALPDPSVGGAFFSPAGSPVFEGSILTLNANVTGTQPITCAWQTDSGTGGGTWTDLPGSTTNTYTLDTTGLTPGNTHQYRLAATNSSTTLGWSVGAPVSVLITNASGPILVTDTTFNPSTVIIQGSNVTLSAAFNGTLPITYQWQHAGTNLPGATSNSLTIAAAQITDAGSYSLLASNYPPGIGASTSNSASKLLYVVTSLPDANAASVGLRDGGSSPVPGAYDVSQLNYSSTPPPGLNYYFNNAAPPGQTFKTGSTPPSGYGGMYPLKYLYIKDDAQGGGTSQSTAQTYTLRIYRMLDGTNALLLTSYTTTNNATYTDGNWIYLEGMTNLLAPNTTYALSLHNNGASWSRADCYSSVPDAYPAGNAVLLPAPTGASAGGTAANVSPDASGFYYDAAFVVGFTPSVPPFEITPASINPPSVLNGQGVTMTANFGGTAPITYQWQADTGSGYTNIPGATSITHIIPAAAYANQGSYICQASNIASAGTPTPSTPVSLAVSAPPPYFVANFAYWNTHPAAAAPGYTGPGVTGSGTSWNRPVPTTATNVFNGTAVTLCQNPLPSVAEDGSAGLGSLIFTAYATKTDDYYWYSSVPGGEITLLDTWMDNQSTNALPFAFSNVVNGVYNLVLFGENGRSTSWRATFSIDGVTQNLTNTSASLNKFVLNDNYVVFTNILVTNGTLAGTYISPGGGTAPFNGAQLQMAYNLENPAVTLTRNPSNTTVVVDYPATFSVEAFGPGSLAYQWRSNGVNIAGATNPTYAADTSIIGTNLNCYDVVVTNNAGLGAISTAATLAVRAPDALAWRGYSADWDTVSGNWLNTATLQDPVVYANGDNVRFDDTSASLGVSLTAALTPGAMTVDAANNYAFTGAGKLSGTMSLTKANAGTATLATDNDYSGTTEISGGTLQVGNGGAAGSIGTGPLTNNGALVFNHSGTVSVPQAIRGAGTLSQSIVGNANAGTLLLPAASSYSGATYISGGTLMLSNNAALGSSPSVTVSSTTGGSGISGTRVTLTGGISIPGTTSLSLTSAVTGTIRSWLFGTGAGQTNVWNGPVTLVGDASVGSIIGFAADANSTLVVNGVVTADSSFAGKLLLRGSGTGVGMLNNAMALNATSGQVQVDDGSTWIFSSTANTWATNVFAGNSTMKLGANNGLPTASVLLLGNSSNNRLDLAGFSQQLAGLNVSGVNIINSSPTSDSTLTYSSIGLSAFTGTISDGATKLNLSVTAGTLSLASATALNTPKSTVSVSGSAILQLDYLGTNRVYSLLLNGVSQPEGYYSAANASPFLAGTGYLQVFHGPSGPATLTNSVSGGILNLTWPAGQGWRLEGQTNSLATGLSGNWGTVTGAADGSYAAAIDASQPAVFYRLVYP